MNKDFAVFILTHGRPDNVITEKTLRKQGYTGEIYFIIDNEDKTAKQYYKNFGDKVIMFDKKAMADKTDEGDNFGDRRTITHARNASFEIAEKIGVKYFIQLDDDYVKFDFRINGNGEYPKDNFLIKNIDKIFEILLNFYKSIPALTIAMAQGGDFIGGRDNKLALKPTLKRKCMNSFICSTDRKFNFVGRMNEDVNTYTSLGKTGNLFLTVPIVSLTQLQTQSNSGGITEMYLDYGTYIKSFYTVMFSPSSVKVSTMSGRIHHRINWNNTVPLILSEDVKLQR